jgi:hypothetical protein
MEQSEAALQPAGASRNWDEDADPNEEGYLPPLPCEPPRVLWDDDGASAADGARSLVVGLAGAGELFVRHCLCGSTAAKRIGVLLLPQAGDISRAPATAEEAAEEPGAAIISRTGETLLVAVAVSSPLPYAAAQPPPASMVAAAGRSRPPVRCVGRLTLCVWRPAVLLVAGVRYSTRSMPRRRTLGPQRCSPP